MGRFEVFLCFWEVLAPFSGMVACTEFRFRRLCNFDLPNKQRFSLQRHKSTRIRLVPNSWDSLLWFVAQSFFLCAELFPVHRASFWHRKSHLLCKRLVPKLQNSAKPNSGIVCRFFVAQSFFLCAELFPVRRAFSSAVHRHRAFSCAQSFLPCTELSVVHRAFRCAQSFLLCTELSVVHRAFRCAQSFPLCTELSVVHRAFRCAQSFLLCTELSAVHRASFWHRKSHLLCKRLVPKLQNSAKPNSGDSLPVFCVHGAFSCAQSFPLCTELFTVHRAFCRAQAQSFFLCAELFPVRRAFRCAQSFLLCTELFPVHRHRALGAKACHPDQRFCRWKLLFYQQPCAKAKEFVFRRILGQYAGILWRDLVLAFGKARQTLLFAK